MLHSRFNRFGWLLAALIQLVLPTFASVADARAEVVSVSRDAAPHAEATGSAKCPRVHPADCVLCRFLSIGATASNRLALSVPVVRVIDVAPSRIERLRFTSPSAGDPSQRAPPV